MASQEGAGVFAYNIVRDLDQFLLGELSSESSGGLEVDPHAILFTH